jgi:pyridoxal 5'-phosphate synthase pdxT subunit
MNPTMSNSSVIGVLAIQGDFDAHARALRRAGANAIEIRRADELRAVDGLILPGGESTTMLKFIDEEGFARPITDFAHEGKPIFGTCAGAILLAREVYNPTQASLGLIDIAVERNAYGRQVDSFISAVEETFDGEALEAVFIRAPKIKKVGGNVEVLARLNGEPVLIRERGIVCSTFHPELTGDDRVHRLFVGMVWAAGESRVTPGHSLAGC